ncbi:NADP-dependent oxidoreductase [Chitinophaga pendula]|uniref:NADP-dependent oxidoreductase n=1 Tax=Chitinophaga TaxID=79328 RepID=UPI000BAFA87E|nr:MULTISPECIES: NADP-dependent oxidoreductase [Chitinophaga]ASZ12944.1 NADP-dependent oxidoreductase [Chitinophaga sp. MD30]UCJ09427.1 NADP-dependent oxidoreductase [Chitinophaga pendula]
MQTRQILLAKRPSGLPDSSNFRTEEVIVPSLKDGEVQLKGLYYSVDPYMRGRMNEGESYVPPFEVGAPITGGVVAEVVESKDAALQAGDIVLGAQLPWSTTIVVAGKAVRKVDTSAIPATAYLNVLGMTAVTAYIGLIDIGKVKEGETVVVSGAAGAVGTVVGQLAKIRGCRVVGIAGTDEKAALLQREFGYDAVINYKTATDLSAAIGAACPKGVDVYFDNVGGEVTDAVFPHLNFHARVPLCGQIASYNEQEVERGPRFLPYVLTRSIMLQGFVVVNYRERYTEVLQELVKLVKAGQLHGKETIVEGFDQLPEAFLGLFSGKNTGKMLVKA